MLTLSWSTQTTALEGGDLTSRAYEHTLQFDCVTSENHESTSMLTEHAVESGAPITSHKRQNPDRVTIEALVTNTPLDAPLPSGGGETTISVETSRGEDSANVVTFSAEFDRMADVVATLARLKNESTPVTLSTRYRTYEDVQIVSVTCPREPGDGDSFRLNLEISEVRIAVSRTVDTPAPREPRGTPPRDRGGQEATEGNPPTSVLQRARDEYERRRAAGESRSDALGGALGAI